MLVIVGIADYHNDYGCYLCGDNDGGSVAESGESVYHQIHTECASENFKQTNKKSIYTNGFWILGGLVFWKTLVCDQKPSGRREAVRTSHLPGSQQKLA